MANDLAIGLMTARLHCHQASLHEFEILGPRSPLFHGLQYVLLHLLAGFVRRARAEESLPSHLLASSCFLESILDASDAGLGFVTTVDSSPDADREMTVVKLASAGSEKSLRRLLFGDAGEEQRASAARGGGSEDSNDLPLHPIR